MNPILTEILSSSWLLHAENPDLYGAILVSLLRGERINEEDFSKARANNRPFVVCAPGSQDPQPINSPNIPSGSTAVIPIRGVIMKEDQFCGPRGTVSLTQDIKSADANPSISSILLVISSPGGQSSYTDILSAAIASCSTPVTAFVEGMAASAAYWIASGAKKIICSSDLDMVGSIGTMIQFADMQGYLEREGVKLHEVYATLSTDKNQDVKDLRAGNYDRVRSEVLDRINSKFHANVTANRPGMDISTLSGKIYFASDAIALGMVDEIGSFEYALEQANSATSKNSLIINNTDMKIKMLATWTAIATFFGFTDDITSKEMTEDMISQVNDRLAEVSTQLTDLKPKLIQAEEDIKAKDLEIATLNSAVAEVTRQFDAFKAQDFGKETLAAKVADKSTEEIASDQYLHNKIADQNS